jgi:predicted peptidase
LNLKQKQLDGVLSRPINLDYLLYQPVAPPPTEGYPLILSLHGAGQRGNDLALLENHGLLAHVQNQDDFPFLVCTPQCPEGDTWLLYLDELLSLLNEVTKQYPVDPDRVIVSGLSMGGNGTWLLSCKAPERFAAAVPICGWGDWIMNFPDRVEEMKSVPTWAFHGADDDTIPLEESEKMVNALKQAGGDVKLTTYPGVGHESWDLAYNDKTLYHWLAVQRRKR